jgi:hypothetical protein
MRAIDEEPAPLRDGARFKKDDAEYTRMLTALTADLRAPAPHGGWFAYVPFTTKEYSPGLGMTSMRSRGMPVDRSLPPSRLACERRVAAFRTPGCSVRAHQLQ